MMPISRFWDLIADSRSRALTLHLPKQRDFSCVHEQALCAVFREQVPEQIIAFEQQRRQLLAGAYRWDIWGAAYWYGGGCGDDAFENFRWNLIALGHEWYERILRSPDELAELIGVPNVPYMLAEWSSQPANNVYTEITGEEFPILDIAFAATPGGGAFDFGDRDLMRAKYPKLVVKLPNMGD